MSATKDVLLAAASLAGGAINAVAGGGTLIAFPAAIAAGLAPIVANATNAVAMTPAALASAWAYRRELDRERALLRALVVPSLLGAVLGAVLLLATPQKIFDAIVPALVLFAALMLIGQNLRKPAADGASHQLPAWVVFAAQLGVGIYGGYFGAGMGFMMLALLGAIGARDIHGMNAVRNVLGVGINGIASVTFLISGAIDLRASIIMSIAAIAGGWAGAAIARRANPKVVRWGIAGLGVVVAGVLAWQKWT